MVVWFAILELSGRAVKTSIGRMKQLFAYAHTSVTAFLKSYKTESTNENDKVNVKTTCHINGFSLFARVPIFFCRFI